MLDKDTKPELYITLEQRQSGTAVKVEGLGDNLELVMETYDLLTERYATTSGYSPKNLTDDDKKARAMQRTIRNRHSRGKAT